MPLDPNIAGLLQFMEASGRPAISDGTPDDARKALRTLLVDMRDPAALIPVKSVDETMVGDGIPARVYRPDADGPAPTIVYLHGGGFVIGDLDTHENVCRMLCRDASAVVVSVDYRLAPEHPFPAAVDDSYAALNWVAGHIGDYGDDASRLAVGGDSAGGNLAAVCAQRAHADGLPLALQLLVYPAVDLLGDSARPTGIEAVAAAKRGGCYPSRLENAEGYFLTVADMRWFALQYVGVEESDPRAVELAVDPRMSPLHAAGLEGLAPAVLVTAEFDPLRDEGNRYAEALAAAGVTVRHQQFPGLIHGFYGMEAISPAAADAMEWVNAQVKAVLG